MNPIFQFPSYLLQRQVFALTGKFRFFDPSGNRLELDFHIAQVDGTVHPFRSTIVRQGPDNYDWEVLNQKDGAWTKMFGLQYKRVRE